MDPFLLFQLVVTVARRFEELDAWQLSAGTCEAVFELTSSGPAFDDETFRKQIRDAAKSAPALIAEGFVRYTAPEFVRYLRMARAELGEVQSHLYIGRRIRYFSEEQFEPALKLADRAMGATTALLKSKLRQLEEESNEKRKKSQKG